MCDKNLETKKYQHYIIFKVLYKNGIEKEHIIDGNNAIIGKRNFENLFKLNCYSYITLTTEQTYELFYDKDKVTEFKNFLLERINNYMGQNGSFRISKSVTIFDINEILEIDAKVFRRWY